MPGPAFCAASAVSTKMPVPMTAPMPSMVSWNAPSERCSDFFSAVANMASRGLTRPKIINETLYWSLLPGRRVSRPPFSVGRETIA